MMKTENDSSMTDVLTTVHDTYFILLALDSLHLFLLPHTHSSILISHFLFLCLPGLYA